MRLIILISSVLLFYHMNAQTNKEKLFQEIPTAPNNYTSGNIISRIIDGLGYRYYWASDSLTEFDLAYRPSETGKTCKETIQHIYDLSVSINNVAHGRVNVRPSAKIEMSYVELRKKSLQNLFEARTTFLNKTASELEEMRVIFKNGENISEFPLWNFINGQLSDGIYHTGQLVVFRRATGNPINSATNVFTGVNKQ